MFKYNLCKDNSLCCDDDCKKCAQRIYDAYMRERSEEKENSMKGINNDVKPIENMRKPISVDEKLEVVEVFGKLMLFTIDRVSRESIPEGCYMYELRHDDSGDICEIKDNVLVNHYGTVISKTPIKHKKCKGVLYTSSSGIDITKKDVNWLGDFMTLNEFIQQKPVQTLNEIVRQKSVHECKYCGAVTDGPDENVLCKNCRGLFGHSFYSEL